MCMYLYLEKRKLTGNIKVLLINATLNVFYVRIKKYTHIEKCTIH